MIVNKALIIWLIATILLLKKCFGLELNAYDKVGKTWITFNSCFTFKAKMVLSQVFITCVKLKFRTAILLLLTWY